MLQKNSLVRRGLNTVFTVAKQGLPEWVTPPAGGPEGEKNEKGFKTIAKFVRNLRKNEESGNLALLDCEAGYGPEYGI